LGRESVGIVRTSASGIPAAWYQVAVS
jgi:hypothetical protein